MASYKGLYTQWGSFLPKSYKWSLVLGLVSRAWRICSSYMNFHQEMEFLRGVLAANGYPLNFVESCIKRFLDKQYNNKDSEPVYGPEKKLVVLSLPYIGLNSFKVNRQLKRMTSAVTPWINLRVVFKPTFRLSRLSKLKSAFPLISRSRVVYKVNCAECDAFYVGKTDRRLKQRLAEHQTCSDSALNRHMLETGHHIDFETPNVIASDTISERLLVKEALKIKELAAFRSLNGNTGSIDMKLW